MDATVFMSLCSESHKYHESEGLTSVEGLQRIKLQFMQLIQSILKNSAKKGAPISGVQSAEGFGATIG